MGCLPQPNGPTDSDTEAPKAASSRNQMGVLEGRAAVASVSTRHTATTERGPPDHL